MRSTQSNGVIPYARSSYFVSLPKYTYLRRRPSCSPPGRRRGSLALRRAVASIHSSLVRRFISNSFCLKHFTCRELQTSVRWLKDARRRPRGAGERPVVPHVDGARVEPDRVARGHDLRLEVSGGSRVKRGVFYFRFPVWTPATHALDACVALELASQQVFCVIFFRLSQSNNRKT